MSFPKSRRIAAALLFIAIFFAMTASIASAQPAKPVTVCVPMLVGQPPTCIQPVDLMPLNGRIPVPLIAGWNQSRPGLPDTAIWNNFIAYVAGVPWVAEKFKFYQVAYYSNLVSISSIGKLMAELVDQMDTSDSGFASKNLILIAHSMGGLIARAFMQENRLQGGRGIVAGDRVLRLVTLATPHHGTPIANGPSRDAQAGLLIAPVIDFFDNLFFSGVTWADYNRFDLHDDSLWNKLDGLDYVRFPQDANVWLTQLNTRNTYQAKISAYAGIVTPANSLQSCIGLDFGCMALVMKQLYQSDNDGVVSRFSGNLAGSCNGCVVTEIFPGHDHYQMAEGTTPNDTYLFNAILGDLCDFGCSGDSRFGSSVTMGNPASEVFHNLRGWVTSGKDTQGTFRNESAYTIDYVDLFVPQVNVPYYLSFQRKGNVCNADKDTFVAYVRVNGTDVPTDILYEAPSGIPQCTVVQGNSVYRVYIPNYGITKTRVTVGFLDWGSDQSAPMYYVRLDPA